MNLYYLGGKPTWQTHSKNTKIVASRKSINVSSISKKRKKINKKTGKIVIFQSLLLLVIINPKVEKKDCKKLFYLSNNSFVNIHSSAGYFLPSE